MSAQEVGKCNFCGEEKPVSRKYVHAKEDKHIDTNKHTPFVIIKYCNTCGVDSIEDVQRSVNGLSDEGKNPERSKISDGYHTFGELYDHRITLYISLCGFASLPT